MVIVIILFVNLLVPSLNHLDTLPLSAQSYPLLELLI